MSTSYCAGTTCMPKKAAGQLCGAPLECGSGLCGGRCCSAGAPCTCPQPQAGNLVVNPGFDTSLAGWTVVNNGTSTTRWLGTEDAASCPFSGALAITAPADVGDESSFSQCVTLRSTGVLNIGIQWKVLPGANNPGIICTAFLTNDTTCAPGSGGPVKMLILSDELPLGWSGYVFNPPTTVGISGILDNSAGFGRLALSCSARNGVAVDMVYVTTGAPGF